MIGQVFRCLTRTVFVGGLPCVSRERGRRNQDLIDRRPQPTITTGESAELPAARKRTRKLEYGRLGPRVMPARRIVRKKIRQESGPRTTSEGRRPAPRNAPACGFVLPRSLWVPGTRPWLLTCRDVGRCWVLVCRILYRFLASLARLTVRSGRSNDLEIIVLRHQLGVLRRQVDRPELTDGDRSLLGAIAAALPRPSRAGWLVTPDTLLRWHRRRIAGHWTPTTATAGPTVDLSRASPTRAAPRS